MRILALGMKRRMTAAMELSTWMTAVKELSERFLLEERKHSLKGRSRMEESHNLNGENVNYS